MTEDKKPWWNDGDVIGGIMATASMIFIAVLMFAFLAKFLLWFF